MMQHCLIYLPVISLVGQLQIERLPDWRWRLSNDEITFESVVCAQRPSTPSACRRLLPPGSTVLSAQQLCPLSLPFAVSAFRCVPAVRTGVPSVNMAVNMAVR